jgi:hypothetical protein
VIRKHGIEHRKPTERHPPKHDLRGRDAELPCLRGVSSQDRCKAVNAGTLPMPSAIFFIYLRFINIMLQRKIPE